MNNITLPSMPELERAVLGALIVESDAIHRILDLTPQMFHNAANRAIFTAIKKLNEISEEIDLLTIFTELKKNGKSDEVGGMAYIASLTDEVATAGHIEAHAKVIIEKYLEREFIIGNSEAIEKIKDGEDVFQAIEAQKSKLDDLINKNVRRRAKTVRELSKKAIADLNDDREETNTPSGINSLDRIIGGLRSSDLIVIAARPGMGKSGLGLSIARNLAIKNNKKVLFFSLEMSAVQMVHRLFSMESGIPTQKITNKNLYPSEWVELIDRIGRLDTDNLTIDDTPGINISEVRGKAKQKKNDGGIDLVIIDYIQLINTSSDKKISNREQEISYISRTLKEMAKELDIPVIALSQLSREVEKRATKRPQLSDLRESGAIEQDADIVMMIYRPEYYHTYTFEDGSNAIGLAEIDVLKNRHGDTDSARVSFDKEMTLFRD